MRYVIISICLYTAIVGFSIYYLPVTSLAGLFGTLAYTTALTGFLFFSFFSPWGMKSHATLFGREYRYRTPVAYIPIRVFCTILVSILVLCTLAFGFYANGL